MSAEIVSFPGSAGLALPPVRLDRVRNQVEKIPLESLARAAQRAYVKAVIDHKHNQCTEAAAQLYLAAFCFARLADEIIPFLARPELLITAEVEWCVLNGSSPR